MRYTDMIRAGSRSEKTLMTGRAKPGQSKNSFPF